MNNRELIPWIVLRCSSANTIPLVRSLANAGYEVWTPLEEVTKQVPRANVKRKVRCALLPSYIFARADQLGSLLALANNPVKDHRDFRVFRHDNRVPLIADECFAPLRLMERKRKPVTENKPRDGETVRLTDGAFAGLSGVVESASGQFSMVRMPGFGMALKIANFYLLHDEGNSYKSCAA